MNNQLSTNDRLQGGTVTIEYVLLTSVMCLITLAPLPGLDSSAAMLLIDALKALQHSGVYLLSMP